MRADQIDWEKWRQLRRAEANAYEDSRLDFADLQAANARLSRSRHELERKRAAGVQGYASGPPTAYAHEGEQILQGVGGYSPEGVARTNATDLRADEARVAADEREQKRIADRNRQRADRLAKFRRQATAMRAQVQAAGETVPEDDDYRLMPPPGIAGARRVGMVEAPDGRSLTAPEPAASGGSAPRAPGMFATVMGLLR